jgi:hypothetical protein
VLLGGPRVRDHVPQRGLGQGLVAVVLLGAPQLGELFLDRRDVDANILYGRRHLRPSFSIS